MVALFNTVFPEHKGQTNGLFLGLKLEEKSAAANFVNVSVFIWGLSHQDVVPELTFGHFPKSGHRTTILHFSFSGTLL